MAMTITVEGMSCEHCEQSVTKALENLEGITSASADHEAEQATVEGHAEPAALVSAVENAGYEAEA